MWTQIRRVVVSLILLASIGVMPYAALGQQAHLRASLVPVWTTGILSDNVGSAGIVVTDLNQDQVTDIVTCGLGAVYVLNKAGEGYTTLWYSEWLPCQKVAVGDRDGDGFQEIYVGAFEGDGARASRVYIFDAHAFQQVAVLPLPGTEDARLITGLVVADVDGDGHQELVVAQHPATRVYDASTLALEWDAVGYGGQGGVQGLGVGDVDGDGEPEIVVNGYPARVLNAKSQTEERAYGGGFGARMVVGHVDKDGRAEIVYITDGVYVFDVVMNQLKWGMPLPYGADTVAVGDTDGDGVAEVLTGNSQWGSIVGYRGSNGAEMWRIENPGNGTSGVGVGDTDDDGLNEVVWAANQRGLVIGNWVSETIEWRSPNLDIPLYVAAADVDRDGQTEIIVGSSSTDDSYGEGGLFVYDGRTHELEWNTASPVMEFRQVLTGQLDADPALEILAMGGLLEAFDSVTHESQWRSNSWGNWGPRAMRVGNVDGDPVEEIVLGLSNGVGGQVQVFDGAAQVVQWETYALDGPVQDLALGALDNDAPLELAVITEKNITVYDASTWAVEWQEPFPGGARVLIANADLSGPGELIAATATALRAWSGADHQRLWQTSLGDVTINGLFGGDVDGDGDEEFLVVGKEEDQPEGSVPSLLLIGSHCGGLCWREYEHPGRWGLITSVVLADVEGDARQELLFGGGTAVQVNRVDATVMPAEHRTYVPWVAR